MVKKGLLPPPQFEKLPTYMNNNPAICLISPILSLNFQISLLWCLKTLMSKSALPNFYFAANNYICANNITVWAGDCLNQGRPQHGTIAPCLHLSPDHEDEGDRGALIVTERALFHLKTCYFGESNKNRHPKI